MKELTKKEITRIRGILIYKIRGLSYRSIAKIYKITAERIRQIVVESQVYPQFNNLNIEIEKTQKFLNRELKV